MTIFYIKITSRILGSLPSWQAEKNKSVFKIKGSLLIKRDIPILNKNISSAKLFLFENT